MRKSISLLLIPLWISCQTPKGQEDINNHSLTIEEIFDEYHNEKLRIYPLEATFLGLDNFNDTLPNYISQEYIQQSRMFYTKYQDLLQSYDKESLSDEERISYDVLKWECAINLAELNFPMELMPLNQISSLHLTIGQLATGTSAQPFKTVKDYYNWLSRLEDYVEWMDTALVNMRKGIKMGYVLPQSLSLKLIPQIKSLDHGPAHDHLFYSPIKIIPEDFNDEQKAELSAAYSEVLQHQIIPVFKRMGDFLENEYLPASRTTSGLSYIPQGDSLYQLLIKRYTTTDLSADEIFEIGQKEVEMLTREMEKVKEQIGFKGSLKAFFDYIRTKSDLMPYDSAEQVVQEFNQIHNRMKPHLTKLFDKVPKTPFEVKRTEAFREKSASAEYNPGSLDGSRPGIFYVPVPDVKTYNIFTDEVLFLHEAIPGHHYQISLQYENEALPDFRKVLWYSAYGEGWALYAESLGKELGLYEDPYQYFGMLSMEMHRAIRLVVDVGMHAKGWTREQAIEYSLAHEAESESSIIAEIERYMAIPGQALSYKIGQLKIKQLRSKAEQVLGEKFIIGEFHNTILESGCLPLATLEEKVDQWIASQN